MTQAYFLRLFGYDKWAMTTLLKLVEARPPVNPRINELLSHMQSTQRIWLDRCFGEPDSVQRFRDRSQHDIWKDLEENHAAWMAYIHSLQPHDFTRLITYNNSGGDAFTNELQDVITHVINHGTHHRGTIIGLMKEENYSLPNLDYITYVRILNDR